MQAFKCHYRSVRWSTRRYFDHVKEVLVAFASAPHQFHCTPPPCPTVPPITTGESCMYTFTHFSEIICRVHQANFIANTPSYKLWRECQ